VYFRLFVDILRQVREDTEIQFIEDGSWSLIEKDKEVHNICNTPSATLKSM